MIDISLYKVNKNFGFSSIFDNMSFDIKQGEKIALVGDNGCGKTTLLNVIAGYDNVNSGVVSIRKNLKIGYLKQILKEDSDILVKELMYQQFKNIIEIKNKMDEYEELLNVKFGKELDKIIEKYTKIQEQFINCGGYEIEAKIGKILNDFNIDDSLLKKRFNDLSGGEKTIVSLASIMLESPDLLLLDEPTNHLDINTLELLEAYLNNYKKTVLIVSHDRYFLNKVAKKIFYIKKGNVDIYFGNYDYYINEKEKREKIEIKNYNNQQKVINKMEKSIKQLKEFGKIGDNEDFFKRAESMQKRLDKIDKLDKPVSKKDIPIKFVSDNRPGKEVLKIKSYIKVIEKKKIFDSVNLDVYYRDKICIMGPNGCGKSTLIKDIINNSASIIRGSNLKIGYIPQEIEFYNENKTVLDEAKRYYIGYESNLRSALSKFYFTQDNVFKKLNTLSGGERIRLKLFCVMQDNYNLLIMDEPTNHIDINTREILEKALLKFNGTLIFISHDRYFINKLATKIVYVHNKKLYSYIGNYDAYKVHIEKLSNLMYN